ncbi:propionyl-CoA synthetase [Hyphomicrobium sp. DMF-1]|jgi:propionyl-CoA synthetase|uniref:propionyl-CoA synthetase n=1 Tax=Hyphomicrobium sp. DMF-1 TaxID=3019544 RepID=UPI0022EBD41C|nr:propionyl-CoA synthetase [Hyphomicrobium sp. DMF-1]WBT38963.1 propionyl-CoA synthetase [Hyphomicrobium sp. DMF-1]
MGRYWDVYNGWLADPEAFWGEAAKAVDWFKPADKIFDAGSGQYGRWFAGAECNTSYNCIDRHVKAGCGAQPAIIYDSPVTGTKRTVTYAELLDEVEVFAAALAGLGVTKGDRVVIYMPMVPEVAVAMLAAARLGAIHSVVFGGFAANELAVRLNDAKPKVIVSASCGIEPKTIVKYKPLLDAAIEMAAHKPAHCVVLQRPMETAALKAGRDLDWSELVAKTRESGQKAACVPVKATDPLYILYTSGSTGQPKGVVRDNGGHMVALTWTMRNIYGVAPGDVFWSASDVGWVVGHSYIIYGPLLNGNTTIIYEGKPVGTPDAGAFWRVISEYKVAAFFTAPTALRAIKKEDPTGSQIANYDLTGLRTLFLAGERADPDTVRWAEQALGIPVIDHWWQTETGWAIAANPIGLEALPVKPGSPTVPMPGYDIHILDEDGHAVPQGQLGNIVVKLPLPPGCLPSLWNADERFGPSYTDHFPGYYKTADAGYRDEDGYLFIMGRTDDIINVAGHRLSTGAMEEVLSSHKDVAECAVIGAADALKGELPVGFIVLKAGVERDAKDIESEIVALVRERIGPVAAFKTVRVVGRLPKTRSGKILRGTIKKIADKADFKIPATIDDPAILDEIGAILSTRPIAG